MEIIRSGSQRSGNGRAYWFTGTVRIDPLLQPKEPARAFGASVPFEPGARTAWHTHPLGRTLIVTAGCGRVQRWGGPIEEIRLGLPHTSRSPIITKALVARITREDGVFRVMTADERHFRARRLIAARGGTLDIP